VLWRCPPPPTCRALVYHRQRWKFGRFNKNHEGGGKGGERKGLGAGRRRENATGKRSERAAAAPPSAGTDRIQTNHLKPGASKQFAWKGRETHRPNVKALLHRSTRILTRMVKMPPTHPSTIATGTEIRNSDSFSRKKPSLHRHVHSSWKRQRDRERDTRTHAQEVKCPYAQSQTVQEQTSMWRV
jgi:hypothetical protein